MTTDHHSQTLSSEFESVPIPLQVQGEVCDLERTFAEAVLSDEKVPFKSSSRQVFLGATPVEVEITQMTCLESNPHAHWNPYLYTIEVTHGEYKWTVKKRYNQFLKLHTAIMLSGRDTDDTGNLESTKKLSSRASTLKVLRRLKTSTNHDISIRFPKVPDMLLPSDESALAKRQQQLQDYLNSILQYQVYRNHHEALDFLEVSELSFAVDLIKSKEGIVKKRSGGSRNRGCLTRGLWYLSSLIIGHKWYKIWMSVQESCVILVNLDGTFNSVILFDSGFTASRDPYKKHSLILENLSQSLNIRAMSPLKYEEWMAAISMQISSPMPGHEFMQHNHFGSFAPERKEQVAKYFICGQDYMSAVADAILQAQEEIYIAGWWLSPEIYLKRGSEFHENMRLDRLLKKKADEGVKVFILLYKELSMALGLNSFYTKKTLMSRNIKVMRHPDRGTKAEMTEYLWAHHEKIVVIDQSIAFVGGIDLCYGRWDNKKHQLTDLADVVDTPTSTASQIKPLIAALPNTSSRPMADGMPGKHIMYGLKLAHDVSVAPVRAIASSSSPPPPLNEGIDTTDDSIPEKRRSRVRSGIKSVYRKAKTKLTRAPSQTDSVMGDSESQDTISIKSNPETRSEAAKRKLSSVARAILTAQKMRDEVSPEVQSKAKKMVIDEVEDKEDASIPEYSTSNTLWRNKDYVNFIVKDVARPDLPDQDNVDRRTTARMPWHDISVGVQGEAARDVARHFIQRWNAIKREKAKFSKQYPYLVPRSYANLQEKSPKEFFKNSGGNKVKCQVLRSGSNWSIGSNRVEKSIYEATLEAIQKAEHYIYIENQFFITNSDSKESLPGQFEEIKNKIGAALVQKVVEAHRAEKTFRIFILLPLLPAFEGDIASDTGNALRTILHFNYISICRGSGSLMKQIQSHGINPSNYVSFCSLRQHGEILSMPVTELIYIHSKLMIIDDKIIICGSANINDRSLLGSRDSEVALILEDQEFTQGQMNGKIFPRGKLAGKLRMDLMKGHLGLLNEDIVADCISDSFYKDVWLRRASKNTKLFDETFMCIPTDEVKNMEENLKYLQKRPLAETDKFAALQKIREIKGYLVLLPLLYLENENLCPSWLVKEGMVPTITWT